mgnify:CR=1 FL=1
MRLKDKIVIVTGAGSGIGRGIALALAKEGANIVIMDVKEEDAKNTAKEVETLGRQALAVRGDVRSSKDIDAMVQKALDRFGSINILVNNAGVSTMNWMVDLREEEDWDFNMDVNAKGNFLVTRAVAKQMIEQGQGGKIVNIASLAGKIGATLLSHYTASKFAVIGFTKAIALEMAPHKITVNAVCPGLVQTSMQKREIAWESKLRGFTEEEVKQGYVKSVPLGRLETPEDVAKVVLFLCSEEADYITGEAISVTGGMMLGF